jgi:hypothetical protein
MSAVRVGLLAKKRSLRKNRASASESHTPCMGWQFPVLSLLHSLVAIESAGFSAHVIERRSLTQHQKLPCSFPVFSLPTARKSRKMGRILQNQKSFAVYFAVSSEFWF